MPTPRAPVRIAGTGSAFPPHACAQADAVACLRLAWADHPDMLRRVEGIAANSGVLRRHLALPVLEYAKPRTFGESNDAWIRVATQLGESASREAIARAGLLPRDIETVVFTTVTGLATPSIDARLVHRLGLRDDVRRMPLFGLGCVAGAAGIARAADLVRGVGGPALLLSVELCSLTLRLDDVSLSNLVAICLFGDGATAAVLTDGAASGPVVVDSRATLYPDSERVMGWDVSERGFRLVLSPEVPDVVRRHARRDVDAFLGSHGMTRRDVARWIVHPGGPKVLEAMQDSLEIGPRETELTWRSLRQSGNLSSSSILKILGDTLDAPAPPDGEHGLMVAMGPGFCSEIVLLRWGP